MALNIMIFVVCIGGAGLLGASVASDPSPFIVLGVLIAICLAALFRVNASQEN